MRILYSTDLHGHKWKYNKILSLIKEDHKLLIIGADILPKHTRNNFISQREFLQGFLKQFFEKVKIPLIIDFGNDDYRCLYDIFKRLIGKYDHVFYSHLNEVILDGVSFIGMHFVPDDPFGLKDWCRRDENRIEDPIQFGPPVISTENGYQKILDLRTYFLRKMSIDVALKFKKPTCSDVVYLLHAPPRTLGLDVCADGRQVGSEAITNFIIKNKPMLTLHGHIHESPWMTKISINSLVANSISIQPGQIGKYESLVYCEFDLYNVQKTFKRKIV